MEKAEYFDNRFYKVVEDDGTARYFPSVTSILSIVDKPFLAHWRGDIGNREADLQVWESQRRGSRIHEAWDCLQKGGEVVYEPQGVNSVLPDKVTLAFQDEMLAVWKLQRFFDIVKPQILASEFNVHNNKEGYAGTIDSVWYIKEGKYPGISRGTLDLAEGLYIVDLKSGKSVGDDANTQIAAYALAYEQSKGIGITGGLVLHTQGKTKTGIEGFNVIHRNRKEIEADYATFLATKRVFDIKKGGQGVIAFQFPKRIKLDIVNNDTKGE